MLVYYFTIAYIKRWRCEIDLLQFFQPTLQTKASGNKQKPRRNSVLSVLLGGRACQALWCMIF